MWSCVRHGVGWRGSAPISDRRALQSFGDLGQAGSESQSKTLSNATQAYRDYSCSGHLTHPENGLLRKAICANDATLADQHKSDGNINATLTMAQL